MLKAFKNQSAASLPLVAIVGAVIAGIVAGTVYQIVQWGYITFQVGMAKYNAIYGSFAALPLFLISNSVNHLI